MVQVRYRNRLGNRLFQYCFGRIVAESLGWHLQCQPIEGFPGTQDRIDGERFQFPVVRYHRAVRVDLEAVLADRSPRRIVVSAWVQHYEYYRAHANQIRRWLAPRPSAPGTFPSPGPRDLLLHMRLGRDYAQRQWTLHPDFYQQVLDRAQGVSRVYLCYDARHRIPGRIQQQCLAPLLRLKPIVVSSPSPIDDLNFARQFRRIAIAPSSFCWWGAYLSEAEEIYFPDLKGSQTSGWRSRGDWQPVRLEVDESRYINLPARTLWDPRPA